MAVLCSVFIACNQEELIQDYNDTAELEIRSANSLNATFINSNGVNTSLSSIKINIDYFDGSTAFIQSVDSEENLVTDYGNNISIKGITSSLLSITVDNYSFSSSDITISISGNSLYYSDSDGSITGTSSSFIIEEDPEGL
jgi:hypothetical protein